MPIMDGYEATTSIRQYLYFNHIKQPIIVAVTAHAELEFLHKAINSGMNQVIIKPAKEIVLREILQKIKMITEGSFLLSNDNTVSML